MGYQQNKKCLQIQNLKVDYKVSTGIVHAVKNVNLEVKPGQISALVGESGSGKSVTSLAVMGLLSSNLESLEGNIWIDGQDILTLDKKKRELLKGKKIGMIFQDPVDSLNPLYTVGNQMIEGIRRHHKVRKEEAKKKAIEYLAAVNLPHPEALMKKYPFELSGGMCQRVMIAIVMSLEPDYLIADEPTTALDVTVQKQILAELYQMSRKKNIGILFITHDLGVVAEIADEVYIMQQGEIVESGNVYRIFENPSSEYTKMLLNAML